MARRAATPAAVVAPVAVAPRRARRAWDTTWVRPQTLPRGGQEPLASIGRSGDWVGVNFATARMRSPDCLLFACAAGAGVRRSATLPECKEPAHELHRAKRARPRHAHRRGSAAGGFRAARAGRAG